MKYLIIGLGNFGKTLAEELTDKGHEVIGVDANEQRVDEVMAEITAQGLTIDQALEKLRS